MSDKQGRLLIVSGPSGVGKGTLLKKVFERSGLPLVMSVSATTRQPRPGEIDGRHYRFLTHEEFERKRAAGEFLECFEVFGQGIWYGTLLSDVEAGLADGKWVVLEIDVQGAKAVKERFPDAAMIFVEPKNVEVLQTRLRGRATETADAMARRLATALEELEHVSEFEHRVVNDDLEMAVQAFLHLLDRVSHD